LLGIYVGYRLRMHVALTEAEIREIVRDEVRSKMQLDSS
jgi:hypothetical protein